MKGEKEDNKYLKTCRGGGKLLFKEFNYFYEVNRTSGNKNKLALTPK
jgi:hypothetical protein